MKFSTSKEHRDFFQKQGWIEFEGLISDDQLNSLNQAIEQVLTQRLNVTHSRLRTLSSEKCFLEGHDLWRNHPFLQRFVMQTRFPEIISELIEKRALRLGSDQFFPSLVKTLSPQEDSQIYQKFLDQITPLNGVSCLRGLACGMIISLNGRKKEEEKVEGEEKHSAFPGKEEIVPPVEGINIFPTTSGSVIFFQPHSAINWKQLLTSSDRKFYMITYTQHSAYYQLEPQDPHTHTLKRLGYILNDKLNDKLHPIVYR